MKKVVALVMVVLMTLGLFGCNEPFRMDSVYYADITIKGHGTITVMLNQTFAPITVENFVKLARSGYYDGLTFHRIIEGFMMQGGAPKSNNDKVNPIKGEFSVNGVANPLKHTRGAISMARTNDMDSATSQFFIVHEDSPHLDGKYACFGYVTSGMEIVDRICKAARPINGNGGIAAADQPIIESIKIREERDMATFWSEYMESFQ